ncbi:D-alanyl-D-alanine carboxypeptidase/D-alanyl-D-alanine-endopeptidase [Streptomyces sp. NBC_01218]|uniref:D-alanyl-D-alanine carboxypeptidase/D-alanyl-D-alanine endopeptidase n=1 Tax=Streptomyces sp. NBC_01218 TaxID=2903780 RepID=UPI002E14F04E|nr:D-alanyl-D-alanine carboxypeptidase/D-alanyl-D-alanine-endopeptidase [Streptomyces sp. NBC_01218]
MAEPVDGPSKEPSAPWGKLKGLAGKPALPDNWRLVAGSAVLGLVVAAGAVFAAGPWDNGQRTAERVRAADAGRTGDAGHRSPATGPGEPAPAPSAAAVLVALGTGRAPAPAGAAPALTKALDRLVASHALGTRTAAVVVDTTTGEQIYAHGAGAAMTPASTVKIATTVAALSALGPDHRIETTVRASPDLRTVTLVGGGDPTLDEAGLRALARATAGALRDRKVKRVALTYDTSAYTGPARHPIGPNDNIAPVSALMIRAGRLDKSDHGPAPRSADPAADAARAFAGYLADDGVTTTGEPRSHRAPARAATLATHRSAPLSALVERTLTLSDNDLAEALARQTAMEAGLPAGFAGARSAVTARLKALGMPVTGTRFADGSGLDRDDRVSASLLAGLLARAADPARPELRPVLTGLPVAGFSGTLDGRYGEKSGGAGLVRAKTGTLTGVNALAGTVVDTRGRLLAFAFLTSGTTAPGDAEKALDALATALATGTR